MKKDQPIIIIKKKGHGHGGHHGGAWKVAYADFVTAMMAFFLVMWLVSQKQEVKAAIGGYFRDPGAFDSNSSKGLFPGGTPGAEPGGTPALNPPAEIKAEQEKARLSDAADRIRQKLQDAPEFASLREQIEMSITAEGLQIELIDKSGSSFFDSGSALLRGESVRILTIIASEIGKLDNDLFLAGHTDSRPYAAQDQYTNWELSTDRANAARRVMMGQGIRADQLKGVRGFADTQLHIAADPKDPRNRRVSILVRSQNAANVEAIAKSINEKTGLSPSTH
jgi:chemotaxis protein MotB